MDGVWTGFSMSDFGQQMRRRTADVPEIHFTILDAAGISPTLVLDHNAKTKEKENWVFFKTWASEFAMLHMQVVLLMSLWEQYWNLAIDQYQSWDNLQNQRLRAQNLIWPHKNSKKRRLLLGLKLNFSEWILLLLINCQKKSWCKVFTSWPRLVWSNSRYKSDEDRRIQRDLNSVFKHGYKKNRSIENAVDKRTEFAEEFRKNCNAQGIQIHSTLSETKASFNERKIRSLK